MAPSLATREHRIELVFRVDDNLSNFLVDQWCCRRSALSAPLNSMSMSWNCIWTVVSAHVRPVGWKKWKLPYSYYYYYYYFCWCWQSCCCVATTVFFFLFILFLIYWVTIAVEDEDEDTWCADDATHFFVLIVHCVFHQQFRGRKCSWKFNYPFSSRSHTKQICRKKWNKKTKQKPNWRPNLEPDFTCIIISFIFDLMPVSFFLLFFVLVIVAGLLCRYIFLFGRRCTSNAKRMERAKEIEMQFVRVCDQMQDGANRRIDDCWQLVLVKRIRHDVWSLACLFFCFHYHYVVIFDEMTRKWRKMGPNTTWIHV